MSFIAFVDKKLTSFLAQMPLFLRQTLDISIVSKKDERETKVRQRLKQTKTSYVRIEIEIYLETKKETNKKPKQKKQKNPPNKHAQQKEHCPTFLLPYVSNCLLCFLLCFINY